MHQYLAAVIIEALIIILKRNEIINFSQTYINVQLNE
jgi:hypothetical protein